MQDYAQTVITVIISTVLSSGIVTIIMRWFVESALKEANEKRKHEIQLRQERYAAEDRIQHAVGRCLFWLYHGAKAYEKTEKRGFWNGELEAAYTELTNAEAAEKEIDRQQLAAANEPK